jgi:hypothetical protein
MMSSQQDIVARRAASLVVTGEVGTLAEAIRQACSEARRGHLPRMESGAESGSSPVFTPPHAMVRRHMDAMRMSQLGLADFTASRAARVAEVEQVMTLLAHLFDGVHMRVAGRAAVGQIESGDVVHIRVHAGEDLESVADAMEEAGLDPPVVGSRAVDRSTCLGASRLGTLTLAGDDLDVVLTICPSPLVACSDRNLTTGRPIRVATLDEVRALA